MITRLGPIWRDALSLLFAVWDARTPMTARLGAVLALAYALSPIDLIPDAIPVFGLGDDLLVVPAILVLAARLLPAPVLFSARARSTALQRRLPWLLPALGISLILGLILLAWGVWQGLSG
ncbi:YkvA family protein [Deinococcus arenicola]|uniref:DUF1232 domain-containing protein n=1 Tax=Deinococcus arenicola TaxID=2994950 RepID=A0ABU4DPZ7_9DEIO|nr:DUF1232 domain-containing protein [Deinococcus sp. ZS9-10]MDV6374498.1 DUF1232 domain-containing protein [Deinococcus sp. ZS9-10]